MSDEDDERMAYYLEIGAIELAGMDESGEMIFKINESAKDIAPDLWKAHEEYVDKSIMELYEAGLINIKYDEDLNAYIEMSEEGKKEAKKMGLIDMEIDEDEIPNN